MKLKSAPTKSAQIADLLEKEIMAGKLAPGDKLASIRDLCEKFSVSFAVVNSAYNRLEKKGLICREHGNGTYVSKDCRAMDKLFGVVTTVQEQAYEGYFQGMFSAAQKQRCSFLPATVLGGTDWEADIDRVLSRNPAGLLVDLPVELFPLERLQAKLGDFPVCFVNRWEWEQPCLGDAVLVDYLQMTVDTLELLRGKGHERLVFVGHKPEPLPFKLRELRAAAAAVGLEFPSHEFEYVCFQDVADNPERLRRVFGGARPPTALFARSDFLLFDLEAKIKVLYPDVPSLEMVGCHDTMWSRVPGREFPSHRIDHEELWRRAARRLDSGDVQGVERLVPELVWRGSKETNASK